MIFISFFSLGLCLQAGLLGNGIYFGDAASTSAQYTTPGSCSSFPLLFDWDRYLNVFSSVRETWNSFDVVVSSCVGSSQGLH